MTLRWSQMIDPTTLRQDLVPFALSDAPPSPRSSPAIPAMQQAASIHNWIMRSTGSLIQGQHTSTAQVGAVVLTWKYMLEKPVGELVQGPSNLQGECAERLASASASARSHEPRCAAS